MPALLTSTSTRPSSATTSATARSTADESVTSAVNGAAVPPASAIEAHTSAARSASTSTTAIAAPACARPAAIAAPSPLAPPVTTATRFSRLKRLRDEAVGERGRHHAAVIAFTAATRSSTVGSTSRSSAAAYGIGVSFAATRAGVARNASMPTASTMRATTSAA